MTLSTAPVPTGPSAGESGHPWPWRRLAPSFGAAFTLDLATIGPGSADALLSALRAHKLLLFRDQRLDEPTCIRVARELGKVWTVDRELDGNGEQPHAVNENVEIARVSNRGGMLEDRVVDWHGDLAHHPTNPYPGRLLYAKTLPPEQWSRTSWVDLEYVYAALLSDVDREEVQNKRGEFRAGYPTSWGATQRDVVRVHPGRGSPWLAIDRAFFRRFLGMRPGDSVALKRRLLGRALVPDSTYRHDWRSGDVILYDNEGTMHRREKVIGDGERTIWRITLEYAWPRLRSLG